MRKTGGLFTDTEDLVRRVPSLTLVQLEAMATGGLFGECFGLDRRMALWTVGATAQSRPGRLPGWATRRRPNRLPMRSKRWILRYRDSIRCTTRLLNRAGSGSDTICI